MSGLGDKIKGAANEIKGDVKKEVGHKTNDPDTVAEGQMDETKGKAQGVKGTVKGAADDIKDTIKR